MFFVCCAEPMILKMLVFLKPSFCFVGSFSLWSTTAQ